MKRVIKLNQKSCSDMSTELRRKAKTTLINNAVFGKFVEIVTKNRNYLVSDQNYNIKKFISHRNKKKKAVYIDLSILEISKIVMHEFWYDYVKPKYEKNPKIFYMGAESFKVYIKTEDVCLEISKVVETRFDTSNNKLDSHFLKVKFKKILD